MTLRERLEWLGRMTLLVFILASAAFLSAITAMRIAIHGREVTMPNLVGKNVSEASQMLQSRGLLLRVADRIYSDQPINVVVRQTPTSGLLMKVSQQAHVVLSLGQRQLQIPLLEGNSLRSIRPMRKNFSRRFFRSASTERTFFGGTMRIMPTPMFKD